MDPFHHVFITAPVDEVITIGHSDCVDLAETAPETLDKTIYFVCISVVIAQKDSWPREADWMASDMRLDVLLSAAAVTEANYLKRA